MDLPEASLLGLETASFSMGLHMGFFFFLYVFIPPISPTSYEDINHIILETIHMASFDLNYLFDGPISKDSPILRYTTKVYWRLVRTSTYW